MGRFSHGLITIRQMKKWTKLLDLCEFDYLHFTQYMSMAINRLDIFLMEDSDEKLLQSILVKYN